MSDYMAQMLNELMGPQRNALPGECAEVDFDHPDVCRDFLVGFCLHDAFRNTKNDLGYCSFQLHDESMKKRYKESKRCGRLGYEEKFLDKIRRMHHDVRRKIEKNEARLAVTQGDNHVSIDPFEKKRQELQEKREILGRRIEGLMEEAQIEGERGNVAAAQTAVEKADELTNERAGLDKEEEKLEEDRQRAIAMEDHVTAGNKQMQVCQVCGCFMLTNDAQQRIDDHLSGKLHIAYAKIKEHIDLLEKEKEDRRKAVREGGRRSEEHGKDRDRDDKDREKDRKDADRERDKDRDRKDVDKERDRKDVDRDRDRKDRDRRDRSRDRIRRSRRSRSRSLRRGRDDRDRRDRDRRDRDRRDRSRSRDRRRR